LAFLSPPEGGGQAIGDCPLRNCGPDRENRRFDYHGGSPLSRIACTMNVKSNLSRFLVSSCGSVSDTTVFRPKYALRLRQGAWFLRATRSNFFAINHYLVRNVTDVSFE
jgi:hypothetical protein